MLNADWVVLVQATTATVSPRVLVLSWPEDMVSVQSSPDSGSDNLATPTSRRVSKP